MIKVEIQNIEELIRSFGKINVQKALNNAMKKSLFTLERTAKINTPVKTGLLRNSYETSFGDLEWTLRNYREYAPYVEARKWFLEFTVISEEENIQTIFDNEISSLIQMI